MAIQIFLRESIKAEFMFTEFLSPIDLSNFYNIALDIQKKRLEEAENSKRSQYTK